jgi:hypothetical protein
VNQDLQPLEKFLKSPLSRGIILVCAFGASIALTYVILESFSRKSVIRQARLATIIAWEEEQRLNHNRLFGND